MNNHAYASMTVDLSAISYNYNLLKSKVGPNVSVAGIVKANAYGLGYKKIIPCLQQQGCEEFFVATLDEALNARKITTAPIYILGGIIKGQESTYIEKSLSPVLNSLPDIEFWSSITDTNKKACSAALHFDTGMNRLGLDNDETQYLLDHISRYDSLDFSIIMSHFSCADIKNHPETKKQFELFTHIAQYFPNAKKSLSNSSGIMRSKDYHFDLVRPGMAVYGLNPTPENKNPMRNVVTLKAKVLQVRNAYKNDSVGYGASYTLPNDQTIATIGVGYADGFFRSASNKAKVYYKDQPCNVLGRVSMDLISIDAKNYSIEKGDEIEIIGGNQSPDDLAEYSDTIGYEVLTSIGNRYNKVYKDN